MRATPIQTAVTAVLAIASGLLSAWYVPAFPLSIAVGTITYLATVFAIATVGRLDPLQMIADTTRLAIRVTATTITLAAGLLLNWLARFDHTIATAQQHSNTRTIYSRAA